MKISFPPAPRRGPHYALTLSTLKRLRSVNLMVKGKDERDFEMTIVSHLQASPKIRRNLITQIGVEEVKKITKASLFGFNHWPDISIGNDGTAIEIKVIGSGSAVRDVLGQGLAYRMHYKFVILVLVDQTDDRQLVSICR